MQRPSFRVFQMLWSTWRTWRTCKATRTHRFTNLDCTNPALVPKGIPLGVLWDCLDSPNLDAWCRCPFFYFFFTCRISIHRVSAHHPSSWQPSLSWSLGLRCPSPTSPQKDRFEHGATWCPFGRNGSPMFAKRLEGRCVKEISNEEASKTFRDREAAFF